MLDLAALDNEPVAPVSNSTGEPLRAPLDMFYRDETQPRKKINPVTLAAFAEDLTERGVMNAIIVRPPDESGPNKGKMKILQGERRWRGSSLAGLPDIPYVIKADPRTFDSYSQVAENQFRENLEPLELALFIQEKVKEGDKKKVIAKKVNIHDTEIPYYLSIVESPPVFRELYDSGRCTSPQYIYKLVKLHEKYAKDVELFIDEADEITLKTITALSDSLTGKKLNNIKSGPADSTQLDLDKVPGAGGGGSGGSDGSGGGTGTPPKTDGTDDGNGVPPGHKTPRHNPANEKDKSGSSGAANDPEKIKKPLLTASYADGDESHDVMLLLNKRPTALGLIFVKLEIDGSEIEVETGKLSNLTLQESNA